MVACVMAGCHEFVSCFVRFMSLAILLWLKYAMQANDAWLGTDQDLPECITTRNTSFCSNSYLFAGGRLLRVFTSTQNTDVFGNETATNATQTSDTQLGAWVDSMYPSLFLVNEMSDARLLMSLRVWIEMFAFAMGFLILWRLLWGVYRLCRLFQAKQQRSAHNGWLPVDVPDNLDESDCEKRTKQPTEATSGKKREDVEPVDERIGVTPRRVSGHRSPPGPRYQTPHVHTPSLELKSLRTPSDDGLRIHVLHEGRDDGVSDGTPRDRRDIQDGTTCEYDGDTGSTAEDHQHIQTSEYENEYSRSDGDASDP
jgi:hypothetical protein